jgi:transposase
MMDIAGKEIYLACGHTDMRKSINGLSVIVQNSFQLEACGHAIFVFCNRNRNRIKILEWEKDGFWLHLKRLEQGHFKWPAVIEDKKTMTLTQEELAYLLGSPGLEQKLRRKETRGEFVI